MNRKDFKKLLIEWRKNFVNEKKLSTFGVDFKDLTKAQKLFVKKVPIDLNLYALGDFEISTSKGNMTLSLFIIYTIMNSSLKSKTQKLSKAIILDKEFVKSDLIPVLKVAFENLFKTDFSYSDFEGNINKTEISKDKLKKHTNKILEDIKEYSSNPEGLVLYFARMTGSIENMADGTVNKISSIKDDSVWKNSLQWELNHDLFHYFEDVLPEEESYKYISKLRSDPVVGKIIRDFEVPYASGGSSKDGKIKFSSSKGDLDNFASIVPYIRSLGKDKKNEFI